MPKLASRPLLLLASTAAAALLVSCGVTPGPGNPGGSVPSSPNKITPTITWAQPAPIANPTPLGPEQLDATSNVAGTFVYSPTTGTVLSAGTQTLSTTFTPTDTSDYNTATASVQIVVNPGTISTACPPPSSAPVSGSAHIAVADTDNGRVLIFTAPFTTGECASVVLGQSDFDSDLMLNPESSTKLQQPTGMALDASRNLYVADFNGGRVMQFQSPLTNDMAASLEIGVPSFSWPGDGNGFCNSDPPASLCTPDAITLDNNGNVWIADTWGGRVLEYKQPIKQAMNASLAIGQPNTARTPIATGFTPYFATTPERPSPPPTVSSVIPLQRSSIEAEICGWPTLVTTECLNSIRHL